MTCSILGQDPLGLACDHQIVAMHIACPIVRHLRSTSRLLVVLNRFAASENQDYPLAPS
jgi:hypothetical protein